MRLHTKRGIRLGLAVGIELFLGYVLVAPLGGAMKLLKRSAVLWLHQCVQLDMQVSLHLWLFKFKKVACGPLSPGLLFSWLDLHSVYQGTLTLSV